MTVLKTIGLKLKTIPWYFISLITLVLLALYFRVHGIIDNHSFWADESYVASFARDVIEHKRSLFEVVKIQDYQPLQVVIVTFFFKLFGVSEFTARLPFILLGTIGVVGAFLVSAELSTVPAGLLAAFLYGFSQLNLSNSTQAKPYSAIETAFLFILFCISKLRQNPKNTKLYHGFIILLAILCSLIHFIGFLVWLPYIIYLITTYRRRLLELLKKPLYSITFLLIAIVLFFVFKVNLMIQLLLSTKDHNLLFSGNNITYLRELFWKEYGFITLPAVFGGMVLFKKNRNLGVGIIIWVLAMLYLWTFKSLTHNIRYLVPLFGLLFVCFSIFWGEASKAFFTKKASLVCLVVAVLLFVGGNKISRKPALYYSPNEDFAADIQIADYKTFYSELQTRFPDLTHLIIYTDVIDAQIWYLPGRTPDATFMKAYTAGIHDGEVSQSIITHNPVYTTLDQFKEQMKLHPKGLLIVEDWDSILPQEIKDYAKKNLHLEIKVDGLPNTNGDNWPLELYSWGVGDLQKK